MRTYRKKPEEIESARVTVYPNRSEFVFTLDEIPGLPEENREVEDLLDVRVPHTRLLSQREHEEMLERCLRMELRGTSVIGQFTQLRDYPIFYRDKTLREIFENYLNKYQLKPTECDQEERFIRVEKDTGERDSNWVKETIEPILP